MNPKFRRLFGYIKLTIRIGNNEGLFISREGRPLSDRTVRQRIKNWCQKIGYDDKQLRTHSFIKGGVL